MLATSDGEAMSKSCMALDPMDCYSAALIFNWLSRPG